MSAPVLGIDIAKQRIEVALLVDGKVKNKLFKNTTEGFETLALWLRKLGIRRFRPVWKRPAIMGKIWPSISMKPVTLSVLSIPPDSKDLPRVS